jgi:hypothetical protein
MRVMVIVKASQQSEAADLGPSDEKMLAAMGNFNAELVKAGVVLAADGLKSSKFGKRVNFSKRGKTVIDGPFTETKELVAGFWIWQVRSIDEAIEWLKRAPFEETEVEIRPLHEAEDFAPADPSGKIRAQERELRKKVETRRS